MTLVLAGMVILVGMFWVFCLSLCVSARLADSLSAAYFETLRRVE